MRLDKKSLWLVQQQDSLIYYIVFTKVPTDLLLVIKADGSAPHCQVKTSYRECFKNI